MYENAFVTANRERVAWKHERLTCHQKVLAMSISDDSLDGTPAYDYTYAGAPEEAPTIQGGRKRACIFAICCFLASSYIAGTIGFMVYYCSVEKVHSPVLAQNAVNLTERELQYVGLITSRSFLNTFEVTENGSSELDRPLDDAETRFLTRTILSGLIDSRDTGRASNFKEYLDYYEREVVNYRGPRLCCTGTFCEFRKRFRSDNALYEIFVNNVDATNNDYAYITKSFCHAYILVTFRRFSAIADDPIYEFLRNDAYMTFHESVFLNRFALHIDKYIESNRFCKN